MIVSSQLLLAQIHQYPATVADRNVKIIEWQGKAIGIIEREIAIKVSRGTSKVQISELLDGYVFLFRSEGVNSGKRITFRFDLFTVN